MNQPVVLRPPTRDKVACQQCATRRLCLLGALPDASLAQADPLIERRTVPPGYTLGTQDAVAEKVQIVQVGKVLRYHRGMDGVRRPIAFSGRGSPFGMFGVWDQPSPTTGITATTVRLCEVSVPLLRQLAASHPVLAQRMIDISVKSTAHMAAWSSATRLRGGVMRQLAYCLLLLLEEGSTEISLPSQALFADLLGTTRESIARAIAGLEAAGAIARAESRRCGLHRERLLEIVRSGAGAP